MIKENVIKPMNLAIIGYGRLGRACAAAVKADEQLALAGIVRRPESLTEPLPAPFADIPAVAHVSELKNVDAALVCVPREQVEGSVHDLLQRGTPIVECAKFEGEDWLRHKQAIAHLAARLEVPAIVGAGWNPGALSLFRQLFTLLTPKGHTEIRHRPGVSLHHATVARTVPGIQDALCTEVRLAGGGHQRYMYVELEPGAKFEDVEAALRGDPLFLDEETLVFPVADLAALEDEGHGVLLERQGTAAGVAHQHLLLEARFSEVALCAQSMAAAARALPACKRRGYSLFDLPPGTLWGQLREHAEREWV